jgi:UDP-N-acetylglucosamine 2-epimerase (non-hydrolysing)
VGTNKKEIVEMVEKLLNDRQFYEQMSRAHNPYGDGNSSNMICNVLMSKGVL